MNLQTHLIGGNSQPIIGTSKAMREIFRFIRKVAPTKATVLITGETGVGKEVIAQAIHDASPRKERPFKAINCSTFNNNELLQSELFGHERGAYTGAVAQRRGVFEQADGSTLLLDEVGEMSLEVQVKFLRVLETHEFTRLGGDRNIKVDVRIVAATNKELSSSVENQEFREDLYYRLNSFRIHIPPLRERREDIPPLVHTFIKEFSTKYERSIRGLSPDALNYLENAPWPGNIRQLKNAVEAAIILATSDILELKDFALEPELAMAPFSTAAELVPSESSDRDEEAKVLLPAVPRAQGGPGTTVISPIEKQPPELEQTIYQTTMAIILSAIRLLEHKDFSEALQTNEEPILISDEVPNWAQAPADIEPAVIRKTLEVILAAAKVLEQGSTEEFLTFSPTDVVQQSGNQVEGLQSGAVPVTFRDPRSENIGQVGMTMAEIERAAICKTLEETDGNKTEAAKILDIGVRTLHRKLEAYKKADSSSEV